MGVLGKVKDKVLKFTSGLTRSGYRKYVYDRPVGKSIVTGLLSTINDLSRFDTKDPYDVFEQLYKFEPEIGGAIDRLSALVAMSYKGFVLRDVGDTLDDSEVKLLRLAEEIGEKLNMRNLFEILTELLLIYGNAYLRITKTKNNIPKLTILPNRSVTIVDDIELAKTGYTSVITNPKYYILNEGDVNGNEEIIKASEIIHIKYKDTPVFMKDQKGRKTYGIYSVSPLMRAVLPVWWKREAMIIDILWRYRSVPREHHIISSESFNLRNYTGTIQERLVSAKADAEQTIRKYEEMIRDQEPDHGYVTLDNIQIKTIDPSGGKYMSPNELINQMTDYIWMAMNIPESVVSGRSRSSYASELVVSGYLSAKVIRIAEKIKEALLKYIRDLIKAMDDSLDVTKLDIKLELVLESSKMELFRQAAIMADLGVFTTNEIRRHLGYGELAGEPVQRDKTRKAGSKSVSDVVADVKRTTDDQSLPMTPQSKEQTLKPSTYSEFPYHECDKCNAPLEFDPTTRIWYCSICEGGGEK